MLQNNQLINDIIYTSIQVRHAQMFGAIGVILYTDPADYASNGMQTTFPHSWWLPGTGVQRGTVVLEGDPLTPGYPATG